MCCRCFFSVKKNEVSTSKIVHLFTIFIAYRILTYLPVALFRHTFSISDFFKCFIPGDYYANLYSVVFILSPFLNKVIAGFDDRNYEKFLLLLLSLFTVIPTLTDYVLPTFISTKLPNVYTVSLYGNGRGFTLINFILLYYIGGYVARINFKTFCKPLAVYIISSLFVLLMMCKNRGPACSYCNFFLVMSAASLVACFKMFKFQNNIVNTIAKSTWGVYCIHVFFLSIYCKFFPYDELSKNLLSSVFHFSACIIFTFSASVLWDKTCLIALNPIENLLKKIRFINQKISVNIVNAQDNSET